MSDDSEEDGASGLVAAAPDVIELLSDDDDSDAKPPAKAGDKPKPTADCSSNSSKKPAAKANRRNNKAKKKKDAEPARSLQAGLVLEEDVDECVQESAKYNQTEAEKSVDDDESRNWTVSSYTQHQQQRKREGHEVELFHDLEFESTPASIEGTSRQTKVEKCRCSPGAQPVALSYITKGKNKGRPYHHCPKTIKSTRCRYFRWAFQAERMHWYRFGPHTGHVVVRDSGFSASDLLQGRVGDCWFLS